MNCQDANISLQLALDGEITPEEQEGLDAHLSECLACRRMDAWLDELRSDYLAVDALDAGFADDVIAAMMPQAVVAHDDAPAHGTTESISPVSPKPVKKTWLRRLWGVARFGMGRKKRPAVEKPVTWKRSAAGSVVWGLRSMRPGLQPAVTAPSLATGWMRMAGNSLLAPVRR